MNSKRKINLVLTLSELEKNKYLELLYLFRINEKHKSIFFSLMQSKIALRFIFDFIEKKKKKDLFFQVIYNESIEKKASQNGK